MKHDGIHKHHTLSRVVVVGGSASGNRLFPGRSAGDRADTKVVWQTAPPRRASMVVDIASPTTRRRRRGDRDGLPRRSDDSRFCSRRSYRRHDAAGRPTDDGAAARPDPASASPWTTRFFMDSMILLLRLHSPRDGNVYDNITTLRACFYVHARACVHSVLLGE